MGSAKSSIGWLATEQGWQKEAIYKVEYQVKCMGLGFSETKTRYFSSETELSNWIKIQREWVRYDDNVVRYRLYKRELESTFVETIQLG